ncbi:hypothetical protein [Microbacterium sp. zg-YB36]|uniref:hypothetical protein n=1 Tax=Microbacterium sp. zg-YB36 TaxID=2969407 RepID=UPI00214ACD54|nr:hypothetical protein [Microbacterium sp. zg-YB36]MDL5350841.1 hypothetical protein [Microbacterium sp. zg-YB36]
MSDLGRFLPLSQRKPGDESAVTSDRRAQTTDVIVAAAGVIAAAPPQQASTLARDFLTEARLREDATPDEPGLLALAARVRDGRRRGIRSLAHTVRAYLLLTGRTGSAPHVPPQVTGAVALYAATTAPLPRRAVVAGHTVRATDDGWEFGRGPVLEGPGIQIAAFLLAVSEVPPRTPGRNT